MELRHLLRWKQVASRESDENKNEIFYVLLETELISLDKTLEADWVYHLPFIRYNLTLKSFLLDFTICTVASTSVNLMLLKEDAINIIIVVI